jgi:hypothetical protein
VWLTTSQRTCGPVVVCDVAGRVMKTLALSDHGRVTWRGDNELGHSVEPGVYYVRLADGSRVRVLKLVKAE